MDMDLLSNQIGEAIVAHELSVVFEPVFNCKSKRVDALKSFINYENTALNGIACQDFYNIVDHNNNIRKLFDLYFVEKTLKEINKLYFLKGSRVSVYIPISDMSFFSPNFAIFLVQILKIYPNVKPEHISLSVVSSFRFISDTEMQKRIQHYHSLGISVCYYARHSEIHAIPFFSINFNRVVMSARVFDETESTNSFSGELSNLLEYFTRKGIKSLYIEDVCNKEQLSKAVSLHADHVSGPFVFGICTPSMLLKNNVLCNL